MSDNRVFAAIIALILLCGVFGIAVCIHRLPCAEYRAGLIAAPPTSSCYSGQEDQRGVLFGIQPPAAISAITPEP